MATKGRRKTNNSMSSDSSTNLGEGNTDGSEELYCICRAPYDKKRFMIACDACEEWFHGNCINLTERESKNIDKYFCFMCKKKNPTLQIVYKKPPAAKRGAVGAAKQKKRSAGGATGSSSTVAGSATSTHGDDEKEEEEEDYSLLPVFLQPDPNKQCFGIDCINPARKNSKFCSTTCGYAFYERALERHLKPAVEKRIANPELFGMKKIEDEMETLRVQRIKFQEEVRKLNVMDGKLELLVAEAKRVPLQERVSSDEDDNGSPSRTPPITDAVFSSPNTTSNPKHAMSPTSSSTNQQHATSSSEYNMPGFKKSSSSGAAARNRNGNHDVIDSSRPLSTSSPVMSPQQSSDPVLGEGTFVCKICGKPVQKSNGLRHVERCYKRAEKYNNFSSGYRAEGEAVKVFCDHFSKKDGSYCKRLKFICPEHYRDNQQSTADEVCGFPLNLPSSALADENFVPAKALPLHYCNDYRRDCPMHYNWENMWRSLIASRKLQTWIKVEENIAREFKLRRQPAMGAQPTFDIVTLLGDNLEYSC